MQIQANELFKTFPNGCWYYNSLCKAIEVSSSAKKYAGHLVVMYDFQWISLSPKQRRKPTITFCNNLSFQPITGMPIIQGSAFQICRKVLQFAKHPSLFSISFIFTSKDTNHSCVNISKSYGYFRICNQIEQIRNIELARR